jgi:hypothetical protein
MRSTLKHKRHFSKNKKCIFCNKVKRGGCGCSTGGQYGGVGNSTSTHNHHTNVGNQPYPINDHKVDLQTTALMNRDGHLPPLSFFRGGKRGRGSKKYRGKRGGSRRRTVKRGRKMRGGGMFDLPKYMAGSAYNGVMGYPAPSSPFPTQGQLNPSAYPRTFL